ncbi:MAG: hypothetical protein GVY18_01785 [Bacteroidetes bacterium]|jgi:hypothetical protein|nr:hypothetical protein [Bacteroidota bacterium]
MQTDKRLFRFRPSQLHRFGAIALAAMLLLAGCDTLGSDDGDDGGGIADLPQATSDELVPLPFFVRAESGNKVDPETTSPGTPLISDLGREPVIAPDGHQVTWGEWSGVDGSITVTCVEEGTRIELDLSGLIPHGVYTIWNVTFAPPGFTGDFEAPGLPAHVQAFGPAGPSNGHRSMFLASADGEGSFAVTTPPGDLGTTGSIQACALEEFEWHVVGLYHFDGRTYGPERGPAGTHAEQFAFVFKQDAM